MFTKRLLTLFVIVFFASGCNLIGAQPQTGGSPEATPGEKAPVQALPTVTGLITPTLPATTVISPTAVISAAPTETRQAQNPAANPVNASAEPSGGYTYILQPGTPSPLPNFVHPELACNWLGVGGQVFDANSAPVFYLVAELEGTIAGQSVDLISMTGAAEQWGPGGYEIKIADAPIDSNGTVWLQFYDVDGNPVSDRIPISTYNDCNRNTILVNLVRSTLVTTYKYYFPMVEVKGFYLP